MTRLDPALRHLVDKTKIMMKQSQKEQRMECVIVVTAALLSACHNLLNYASTNNSISQVVFCNPSGKSVFLSD